MMVIETLNLPTKQKLFSTFGSKSTLPVSPYSSSYSTTVPQVIELPSAARVPHTIWVSLP